MIPVSLFLLLLLLLLILLLPRKEEVSKLYITSTCKWRLVASKLLSDIMRVNQDSQLWGPQFFKYMQCMYFLTSPGRDLQPAGFIQSESVPIGNISSWSPIPSFPVQTVSWEAAVNVCIPSYLCSAVNIWVTAGPRRLANKQAWAIRVWWFRLGRQCPWCQWESHKVGLDTL